MLEELYFYTWRKFMKHIKRLLTVSIILILLIVFMGQVFAATSPGLGDADSFLVFGASAVTNVPTSFIDGDVGLSPAAGTNYSGLDPLEVSGTIYAVDATGPAGVAGENPGLLTSAKAAFEAAYDDLSAGDNAACTLDYGGAKDLVGETLVPGVYCATVFSLTGTLTLDNSSDPLGVWIFRSSAGDTSLFTGVGATVEFADEEVDSSCGVWWKVPGTATIASGTSFIGNILALTSVTMGSGASLEGRVFAETAEVTLNNNTITYPVCNYVAPTPTTRPGATAVPGLPETGSGSFILNEMSLWSLVFVGGVLAIALFFGAQSLRKADRPKK